MTVRTPRVKRKRVRRLEWKTRSVDTFELADETKDSQAWIDARCGGHPDSKYVYDPQSQHRIPESGAWVMIVRALPPIERGIDRHIKVGRFFYALRSSTNVDEYGFDPSGTYRALLQTEWGDVWVWPYEYAKVGTKEMGVLTETNHARRRAAGERHRTRSGSVTTR